MFLNDEFVFSVRFCSKNRCWFIPTDGVCAYNHEDSFKQETQIGLGGFID